MAYTRTYGVARVPYAMPPAPMLHGPVSVPPGPVSLPPGPPTYTLPGAPGVTPSAAAPPAAQQPPAAREITDEDVARVAEMFPEMNRSDVRAVLVAKAGNAEQAINELLQMSNSNSVQLANTTNNAHC
jgi:hypothetical protein